MSTRPMFRSKSKSKRHLSKDEQKIDNTDMENSNNEKEKPKRTEKPQKLTNIHQISENDSEDERKSPKNNKQRDRKRSTRSDISDRSYQDLGSIKTNPISRDISIEGQVSIDAQIERGIMGLVEKDIARIEKKQYPPRPQSLSFYEDELSPTDADLSGQLQTLSPTEKVLIMTQEQSPYSTTINANANIELDSDNYRKLEGVFQRGGETSINLKGNIKIPKAKSRKNKQGDDSSMGDSREEIIPGKTKKTRKKKEESPTINGKKPRKNNQFDNQSFYNEGYEPNTDVMLALQDLQDDVFEGPVQVHGRSEGSPHCNYQCPQRCDKVYVQKKDNSFQAIPRERIFSCDVERKDEGTDIPSPNLRSFVNYTPLELAIGLQKCWGSRIAVSIYGLLAGIALLHIVLICTINFDVHFLINYAYFSHVYASIFYIFCLLCTVAVFDKYDISRLDVAHIQDLWLYRKSFIVILIYPATLLLTLVAIDTDNRFAHFSMFNRTENESLTLEDVTLITTWKNLSISRAAGAIIGWIIIAFGSKEDLLYENLNSMSKYNTEALQFSQS